MYRIIIFRIMIRKIYRERVGVVTVIYCLLIGLIITFIRLRYTIYGI